MWLVTLLTAIIMALLNCCTILIISFVVKWKFHSMQDWINWYGVMLGGLVLVLIATALAMICCGVIFFFDKEVGSSGAPENKGWLNGNPMPGLFTLRQGSD